MSSANSFEGFQLPCPNHERETCLVLTQWSSEEDFQAGMASTDFAAGHAQHRQSGPVGTGPELWPFDVPETERPDHS